MARTLRRRPSGRSESRADTANPVRILTAAKAAGHNCSTAPAPALHVALRLAPMTMHRYRHQAHMPIQIRLADHTP